MRLSAMVTHPWLLHHTEPCERHTNSLKELTAKVQFALRSANCYDQSEHYILSHMEN